MKRQFNMITIALAMTVAGSAFAAPARETRDTRGKQEETRQQESLRQQVTNGSGKSVGSTTLETKVGAAADKIKNEAAKTSEGGQGEKAALGIVKEWNDRANLTAEERTAVTKAIAALKDAKDGEQARAIEEFAAKEGLDAQRILTECGK